MYLNMGTDNLVDLKVLEVKMWTSIIVDIILVFNKIKLIDEHVECLPKYKEDLEKSKAMINMPKNELQKTDHTKYKTVFQSSCNILKKVTTLLRLGSQM